MNSDELKALIRTVPDFPKPGILFRDITTLIGDGRGLAAAVAMLAERADAAGAQAIAGIEARGFIFGAAVAARLGLGFLPVRKPGKLPVPVLALDYALEYGSGIWRSIPARLARGSAWCWSTTSSPLAAQRSLPRGCCIRPGHWSKKRCSSSICPILAARIACAPPD